MARLVETTHAGATAQTMIDRAISAMRASDGPRLLYPVDHHAKHKERCVISDQNDSQFPGRDRNKMVAQGKQQPCEAQTLGAARPNLNNIRPRPIG